jgi:hypothetical protein
MEDREERSGLHTSKGNCESSDVSVACSFSLAQWYEECISDMALVLDTEARVPEDCLSLTKPRNLRPSPPTIPTTP